MTILIVMGWAVAQETPVVLKGGKLLTVTHGVIENGVVVMQGGKITAVGAAGSVNVPSGAQVIDATGMTVYPGLIDSETSLGLTEISAEAITNDLGPVNTIRQSSDIVWRWRSPKRNIFALHPFCRGSGATSR